MTKHMIKFSTMCMLMNLKPDSNQQELFAELSKCEELSKVVLKRNEKTLLNNLHKGVCDTLHCGYSSLWLFYTLVILDCGYSTLWLFFTRITLHSGYSQLWLLYTRIILHCGYPPLIECVSFSVTHSFTHPLMSPPPPIYHVTRQSPPPRRSFPRQKEGNRALISLGTGQSHEGLRAHARGRTTTAHCRLCAPRRAGGYCGHCAARSHRPAITV